METGAAKRRRQQCISDFFLPADSLERSPSTLPRPAPTRPGVPDVVQSSLINVGMRVRKAVPEGYKNVQALPLSPASLNIRMPRQRPNELTPFCGIHKIGAFETSFPAPERPSDIDLEDIEYPLTQEDAWSTPTSSQESNASFDAPPDQSVQRKRSLAAFEHQQFSNSPPFSSPAKPPWALRRFKIPTSRLRSSRQMDPPRLIEDMDFEDASFLCPYEDLNDENMYNQNV